MSLYKKRNKTNWLAYAPVCFKIMSLLFLIQSPYQGVSRIIFQKSLVDYQLVPRERTTNQGRYTWQIKTLNNSFSAISSIIKAEGSLFHYQKTSLDKSQSTESTYEFSTTFVAQKKEYTCEIYAHTPSGDSVSVRYVKHIVCGDIYVLYGQSNMIGLADYDELTQQIDDTYLRNFDFIGGNYVDSELRWTRAKEPYARVGGIGLRLQQQILDETGIPTCIINGAVGGMGIRDLANRTTIRPEDVSNIYGRLVRRVQLAGAVGKIRAILWRQGENEGCTWKPDIDAYPAQFTQLWNNLRTDLGELDWFINCQTNIHSCTPLEAAGELREWMRKTSKLFPSTQTMTALGVEMGDGLHHTSAGYSQLADEYFQLLKTKIYGIPTDTNTEFPDIQHILLSPDKYVLRLIFQDNQMLVSPKDTLLHGKKWTLKNHFFINETTHTQNEIIDSVRVSSNTVTIYLNKQIEGGYMTYIPSYVDHPIPDLGALLSNIRGRRVLAFYQFPIKSYLGNPYIQEVETKRMGTLIQLNQPFPIPIQIQKSVENSNNFKDISRTTEASYLDTSRCTRRYEVFYRVRLHIPNYETIWSPIIGHPCTPVDLLEIKNILDKPTELYARKIRLNAPIKHNIFLEYTESLLFQPNFQIDAGIYLHTKQIQETLHE